MRFDQPNRLFPAHGCVTGVVVQFHDAHKPANVGLVECRQNDRHITRFALHHKHSFAHCGTEQKPLFLSVIFGSIEARKY
jgi:hypothetical protein